MIKEKDKQINKLLDELNDYKRLLNEFGDDEYKTHIEHVLLKLTQITE